MNARVSNEVLNEQGRAVRVAAAAANIDALQLDVAAQPQPTAPAGHAVVRVQAAAINPSDVKASLGLMPSMISPFSIFLARMFAAQSLPYSMIEAARIDGAGEGTILRRIVLPVLKPILITLALFVFLGSWNDFMWPLIILSDQDLHTLPVALAALSREHVQDNELMMAGSVVTTLPVLVLFLALQRYYLDGLLAGSVKG